TRKRSHLRAVVARKFGQVSDSNYFSVNPWRSSDSGQMAKRNVAAATVRSFIAPSRQAGFCLTASPTPWHFLPWPGGDLLRRGGFPNIHGAIAAASGNPLAVGRNGETIELDNSERSRKRFASAQKTPPEFVVPNGRTLSDNPIQHCD